MVERVVERIVVCNEHSVSDAANVEMAMGSQFPTVATVLTTKPMFLVAETYSEEECRCIR